MRALPLFLLVGCGDISNALLLEDAAFIDALPSEERHTVALEASAAKGLGDAPSLLQLSYAVSSEVNRAIFEVLWAVDEVRELRPTERTDDTRRWGPFDLREGAQVEVWVERTGAGRYDWGVDAFVDGEELPYIAGTHYAGETVAAGDGRFLWTFDDLATRVGDPARGTVEVDYDNRLGVDLIVRIDGVTDGSEPPVSADYAYRLVAGEGDFQYATSGDLGPGDGLIEDYWARTRWFQGEGGRADVVVNGGSLGGLEERWTQCWDGRLALVHETDTLDFVTTVGDEADCAFSSFAEVDRL